MKHYELEQQEAHALLEEILDRCELHRNTISLETFISYSYYRKEKYAVQKRIIIGFIILFLLVPLLFVRMDASLDKKESKYLSLFVLKVDTWFPIHTITATIDGEDMPVFENSDGDYVIKAKKNGVMEVTVTLWNNQFDKQTVTVSDCDEMYPILEYTELNENNITIYLRDEQSGINYKSAYAIDYDGNKIYPTSYDEASNSITFPYDQIDTYIYVSDNAGNKTKIKIK